MLRHSGRSKFFNEPFPVQSVFEVDSDDGRDSPLVKIPFSVALFVDDALNRFPAGHWWIGVFCHAVEFGDHHASGRGEPDEVDPVPFIGIIGIADNVLDDGILESAFDHDTAYE